MLTKLARGLCYTQDDLERKLQIIQAGGYAFHHSATTAGYFPKKYAGRLDKYSGRMGDGFALHLPSEKCTTWHNIVYFLKTAKNSERSE